MQKVFELSKKEACQLILQQQLLQKKTSSPLETLRHLGYVQIDTISVVERAHHHVFWTRNEKYRPKDLETLIESRQAFEYWSHAAAILPIEDYRFTLPSKASYYKRRKSDWSSKDISVQKYVLDRIKSEGPLQAKDFGAAENRRRKSQGWWDWKPAKTALERLFLSGKLEISQRKGFQKVFDLSGRVIPKSIDETPPSEREYAEFLIQKNLQHHAISNTAEMAYLRRGPLKKLVQQTAKEMREEGSLVEVKIKGLPKTYYSTLNILKKKKGSKQHLHILSPFDNFVIQRKKLIDFFGFDYQIECYIPAAKRKYGYFSLPVIYGDQFIGRIDCKAERKARQLIVLSQHWEKRTFTKMYKESFEEKLNSFANFNSCDEVIYN